MINAIFILNVLFIIVVVVVAQYGCIVSSSADGGLKVWSHMGVYLSSLMAPHSKCNSCDLFVSLSDDEGKLGNHIGGLLGVNL